MRAPQDRTPPTTWPRAKVAHPAVLGLRTGRDRHPWTTAQGTTGPSGRGVLRERSGSAVWRLDRVTHREHDPEGAQCELPIEDLLGVGQLGVADKIGVRAVGVVAGRPVTPSLRQAQRGPRVMRVLGQPARRARPGARGSPRRSCRSEWARRSPPGLLRQRQDRPSFAQ